MTSTTANLNRIMIKLLEHTRKPDITFNRNGIIQITSRLARALSLCPGDAINITISKGEYLLHSIKKNGTGRLEAQCYQTKKGNNHYCANSVKLCRAILNMTGTTKTRVSFMTGTPITINSTTYIPIITLNPL